MRKRLQSAALVIGLVVSSSCFAGVDIYGPVQAVQIAANGNLMFKMETTVASTYCTPGWNGFTMYIPHGHADYAYYYGMLMTAVSKGKSVFVANISMFTGTTQCDVTQTGYGLSLFQ